MIKILRLAKKSWHIMLLIIALLVIQANCELALPQYTSDIVDTGIQYKGIERPVPEVVTEKSFAQLLLFVEPEDQQTLSDAYRLLERDALSQGEYESYVKQYPLLAEENLYLLDDSRFVGKEGEDALDRLGEKLIPAELLLAMLTSQEEEAVAMQEALLAQMGMGQDLAQGADLAALFARMPREMIREVRNRIFEQMGDMADTMGKSMAIRYVQEEYDRIGLDVGSMQMQYLGGAGVRMLLLSLLGMASSIVVAFLSSRLAASTGRDVRKQVFTKVVSFSNGEINRFSNASLITRCTNDIQQIQMVLVMMFRIVAYAPIMGFGGIVRALQTNTSMTWIIAVAVGTVFCLVAVVMCIAMPKFRKMQSLVDGLNLVSREILTGIPVIRAFGREAYEEERFDRASRDLMKTQLFTNRVMTFMMPAMMLVMNGVTVLIIWVGAQGIDMGTLQVGDMMAFITYTMQIVMSFLMITMISIMIPRASVAAGRIEEVLKTETAIRNPETITPDIEGERGRVRFSHVSFRYPGAEEDVLQDIDFIANPGETTAIIGSTGCGKTTLVSLIPRLFDVTEGSITVNGVDVRQMDLSALRRQIGFVPQKGTLFSGTIESNIKFGAPEISEDEMKTAARIAQAEEFIEAKAERYGDAISQGGTNVSGGQKQRLSIARAIAKNPRIYIFDDSFSALDYKTDIALRKALRENVGEAAVIIVAQRISTIIHADKIIVLDEGRIAGIGTHQELLADNEVYRQIAYSQLSREELEGKSRREAR